MMDCHPTCWELCHTDRTMTVGMIIIGRRVGTA